MKELYEEVYPGQLTVYHRTKDIENLKKIMESGVDVNVNRSAMYGRGLYTCYDIESQLTPNMSIMYGEVLIKFAVKRSNNMIMLEPILGNSLSIVEECLGKFVKNKTELDKYILDLEQKWKNNDYTSDIALVLSRKYYSNMDAILFTGKNDGKVVVVYNKELLSPIGYAEGVTTSKPNFNKIPLSLYNKNTLHKKISGVDTGKLTIDKLIKRFVSGEELIDNEKEQLKSYISSENLEDVLKNLKDPHKVKIIKFYKSNLSSQDMVWCLNNIKDEDSAFEVYKMFEFSFTKLLMHKTLSAKEFTRNISKELLKRIMLSNNGLFEYLITNVENFFIDIVEKMDIELLKAFKETIAKIYLDGKFILDKISSVDTKQKIFDIIKSELKENHIERRNLIANYIL